MRRPKNGLTPIAACLAIVASGPAAASSPAPLVGVLEAGDSAFWDGPHTARAGAPFANLPGTSSPAPCRSAPCFDYRLEVGEGGAALRVALDHPSRRDAYSFDVIRPSGEVAATDFTGSAWGARLNDQSAEIFVEAPEAGTWRIRVSADDVVESSFRMRAKLEGEGAGEPSVHGPCPVGNASPPVVGSTCPTPPNLRNYPPHELTFALATTQLGPPVEGTPTSCSAHELTESGAQVCLRFSVGPANVGPGPLDLLFDPIDDPVGQIPVRQRVYRADGSFDERASGFAEYHRTHGHYHFTGLNDVELFRVTDGGTLSPVGTGSKSGFCTDEVRLADWRTFTPYSSFGTDPESSCGIVFPPQGARMILKPGWADIYSFERDDNYVEFGGAGDGVYVIRSTADADDLVLESDETDNVSYVHFRVTGRAIEVFERGYGRDPWDPRKKVADPYVDDVACVQECM